MLTSVTSPTSESLRVTVPLAARKVYPQGALLGSAGCHRTPPTDILACNMYYGQAVSLFRTGSSEYTVHKFHVILGFDLLVESPIPKSFVVTQSK